MSCTSSRVYFRWNIVTLLCVVCEGIYPDRFGLLVGVHLRALLSKDRSCPIHYMGDYGRSLGRERVRVSLAGGKCAPLGLAPMSRYSGYAASHMHGALSMLCLVRQGYAWPLLAQAILTAQGMLHCAVPYSGLCLFQQLNGNEGVERARGVLVGTRVRTSACGYTVRLYP